MITSARRHSAIATNATAATHSAILPPVALARVASAPDWSALPPDPNARRAMM